MTEKFIQKAIEVHGDEYDYSKVEYINNLTEVLIICKQHGEFWQLPTLHKKGNGCSICGRERISNSHKMKREEFIKKAIKIHGYRYDYSKVEYVSSSSKVIIICGEQGHGEFLSTPNNHLQNHGCRLCANNYLSKSKTNGLDSFISRAKTIHRDKYDYSKFIYKNCKSIGIIICLIHGDFTQSAESHYLGCGCPKCSSTKSHEQFKKTTEEFIKDAKKKHGDLYDYSKVDYSSTRQLVIIICRIHGEFLQRASSHIKGAGCFVCGIIRTSDSKRYTTETFIESARETHRDVYDYSKVEYISSDLQIIIICKKHGEFLQTATSHLCGSGCPLCVNKTESKLYEKLLSVYPTLLRQFKKDWCKRKSYLPYDFCIPECKIIIELDGAQHFRQVRNWSSPEEQFENDKYKEECANQNGYSVIRLLQEDVFYDTYDWVKKLCEAIEEIKSSEGITNVYLCNNDEYDQF
jgi:very-short-patch-repair endonuclease